MATRVFPAVKLVSKTAGWLEAVGGVSFPAVVDPGFPISHDDDTSYARHADISSAMILEFQHDLNFVENIISIQSLDLVARIRRETSGTHNFTLRVDLDGSNNTSSNNEYTSSYADDTYTISALRPGGGSWTAQDLRNPTMTWRITIIASPGQEGRLTSFWLQGDVTVVGAKLSNMTRVASRRLLLLSRPLPILTVEVGAEWLKAELGSVIPVTHYMVPGSDAGLKSEEQRPYILTKVDHDPTTLITGNASCTLTLVDARKTVAGLWVSESSTPAFNTLMDGVAALDAGGAESFQRASTDYIEDNGKIIEVPENIPSRTTKGLYMQNAATSDTENSNFNLGIDSGDWTLAGEALNGSALDDDTVDLFWDSTLSAQSLKMTAGSPLGGTDLSIGQISASVGNNRKVAFSITHKDDSGIALGYLMQQSVENTYFQESSGTWIAGYTVNPLPISQNQYTRDSVVTLVKLSAARTVDYRIVAATTAGQINHVSDVDFEIGAAQNIPRYAQARMRSTTGSGSRAGDEMSRTNPVSNPIWYNERVTGFAIIQFDRSDSNFTQFYTIFWNEWDSNNSEFLALQGSTLWYTVVIGGTSKSARVSIGSIVVKDTEIKVAFRRTSSASELGLGAFRSDVFINGVKGEGFKGTGVTHSAGPPATSTNVFLGCKESVVQLDGYLKYYFFTPQILSDGEIARLP